MCSEKKKYKTHHTNAWNERKPRTVLLVAWKRDCKKYETTPPCFLTSVLGNIFTWRHRDATQCVISCLIEKSNIFFSQFNFIFTKAIDGYWIGTFFIEMWAKMKNDKQNWCAISSNKLKSQRICYYLLSYFLTLDIFRHSKILKNDKNYSVCTLLNPFYFVCCLFIWAVKIVCWIGT